MEQKKYIEQDDELEIREVLYAIKKRLALVLILPIIFSGIAAAINYFVLKPVYEANISIIISKDEGSTLTQSDVSMYQSLVKTYIEIAKSDVVAERAIKDGNLEMSVATLQSSLTVSSQEETQIIRMSLNSGQATDAVEKVEALAQAFLYESKRLLPSGNIEIMDHAKVPQSPMKPKRTRNVIGSFAIGLMTAIALAILIEYIKDTVKSEEDIEKYFGKPVLGIIPKHM